MHLKSLRRPAEQMSFTQQGSNGRLFPLDKDTWVAGAVRQWLRCYGRPRSCRQAREHKGIPQPKRQEDGSEAAYLRVRKAITKSLVGPIGELMPKVQGLGEATFNDKQVKELAFNDRKQRRAKVEALMSGYLESTEVTDDLQREVLGKPLGCLVMCWAVRSSVSFYMRFFNGSAARTCHPTSATSASATHPNFDCEANVVNKHVLDIAPFCWPFSNA